MVSKTLLVFCDGTGKDGTLSSPNNLRTPSAKVFSVKADGVVAGKSLGKNVDDSGSDDGSGLGQQVNDDGGLGQKVNDDGGLGQKVNDDGGLGQKVNDDGGLGQKVNDDGGLGQKVNDDGGLGQKVSDDGGLGQKVNDDGGLGQKVNDDGGLGQKVNDDGGLGQKVNDDGGLGQKVNDGDGLGQQHLTRFVAGESPRRLVDGSNSGDDHTQYATNVLRLSRSVQPYDKNGNRQIVFYQSGVGSEADYDGDQVTGTGLLQALGTAVASKIRDAYVFIAQNFEDGDEICLFGFSRGAYIARKLSGLIDAIGLLTRQNLSFFFEIWRQLVDGQTPTKFSDTRYPDIKCVGVWDTVGSVYNQIDALSIKDTSLPATVKVALHAVSLQENRKKFLPTLWTIPDGGSKPGQVLKQVWFAGAHSGVGGGYERHELADISVFWMAGEIQNLINLDLDFLRSYAQPKPDAWGTSQPHNAYMETPWYERPVIGHETRLKSGQITPESVFHSSVQFSPQTLESSDHMTTMSLIEKKFGSGFQPQYPPLNEFEQSCKDHWGSGLGTKPGMPPPQQHGIESPAILLRPRVIKNV